VVELLAGDASSVLLRIRNSVRSPVKPSPGTALIAFKVQPVTCEEWEHDALAEDHVHRRASIGTALFPSGRVVRGKDVVPVFMGGASVSCLLDPGRPDQPECDDGCKDEAWFRITAMEALAADAATLESLTQERSRALSVAVYCSIERALSALWLIGVVHLDLHFDNVLILPDGRIKILDFGMGTILPRDLRRRVAAMLTQRPVRQPPDSVFDPTCLHHCHTIMARRGVDAGKGNYDGTCLRSMRRQWWTRDGYAMIAEERATLWSRKSRMVP
jgi:hypothetical protein